MERASRETDSVTDSDRQRKAGLRVRSAGRTDIGRKRRNNQDSFRIDDELGLYLVADGVGGGSRGDLASQIAVDTIREWVGSVPATDRAANGELESGFRAAHDRIRERIARDPSLQEMATTAVGLLLEQQGPAVIAHVGDSRAYRLHEDRFERLTRDHTLLEEWKARNASREELDGHPWGHILSRALSVEPEMQIDSTWVSARPGDIFLLCSDGLTGMLTDTEITAILKPDGTPETRCDQLIEAALENGGEDNVTVVLVEILD